MAVSDISDNFICSGGRWVCCCCVCCKPLCSSSGVEKMAAAMAAKNPHPSPPPQAMEGEITNFSIEQMSKKVNSNSV
jgi:hypothetical protein